MHTSFTIKTVLNIRLRRRRRPKLRDTCKISVSMMLISNGKVQNMLVKCVKTAKVFLVRENFDSLKVLILEEGICLAAATEFMCTYANFNPLYEPNFR